MKKNISTCLLVIIFLLAGCNNGSNEKKSETGIKQVENKDINIAESKKKPIPEVAKKPRRYLKTLSQPQLWWGKHGFNKYR